MHLDHNVPAVEGCTVLWAENWAFMIKQALRLDLAGVPALK
jgi:hypothetical protein